MDSGDGGGATKSGERSEVKMLISEEKPTEQELLYLLLLKAAENDFQTEQVKDKTLYGEDAAPWRVFGDDDH
ncbi:hypothetical protein ACH5RR_036309 [Cinchona calisaya]|uniref:Uncharacterized protein n=1 Tax=Cinchona calisaya TaxID=153742 RepID=A0ABD2Y4S5_9GENT